MKTNLLLFFFFTGVLQSFGQLSQTSDSVKVRLKFKDYPWYVRTSPFSIYASSGKLRDRAAQWVEVGKTFDIMDVGLSVGRNSLHADSLFLEGKVTMDVANNGRFANEMTIGAGKLFNGSGGCLMLEASYSLFIQVNNKWGIGLLTGYYDFSNESYEYSKTYYGIFLRFGVQRSDTGGLLGMGRSYHRPRHIRKIR
jgi:hypothetical protein